MANLIRKFKDLRSTDMAKNNNQIYTIIVFRYSGGLFKAEVEIQYNIDFMLSSRTASL
jgi:hypothetical protein